MGWDAIYLFKGPLYTVVAVFGGIPTAESKNPWSQVAEQAARAAGCLMREQVGAKVIRRKAFAADLLTAVDQSLGSQER